MIATALVLVLCTVLWGKKGRDRDDDDSDGGGDRPFNGGVAFDFSDDFYRENGVNPNALLDRLDGSDARSTTAPAPGEDFRDVKILELTGGFDHGGDPLYYTVTAKVMPTGFTLDEAGSDAIDLANESIAYIFPKKDGNPLGPPPPNRRQDNVFETRHGYFSNNKLGIWKLVFVSYTQKAFNRPNAKILRELREENGVDLDGTPVIKETNDIEDLEEKGFVTLRTRNLVTGEDGFPWVI